MKSILEGIREPIRDAKSALGGGGGTAGAEGASRTAVLASIFDPDLPAEFDPETDLAATAWTRDFAAVSG
ncbi:MAG TPA: hypothetical protein VGL53_23485 [Bryobacteraceae bacterium]|jgi:hypothetical protein